MAPLSMVLPNQKWLALKTVNTFASSPNLSIVQMVRASPTAALVVQQQIGITWRIGSAAFDLAQVPTRQSRLAIAPPLHVTWRTWHTVESNV
jgi:hypothetical protein